MDVERRLLQGAFGLAAVVPVLGGLIGLLAGAEAFGGAGAVALDGHVRYLSGLLLALGLAIWAAVPAIERRGVLVRMITAAVVLGGTARLYGAWRGGWPDGTMHLALVMELVVTPILCLWQARVAAQGGGSLQPYPSPERRQA